MSDNKGVIRVQGIYPDLIVKDHGGYQSRHASTLALLRETFTTYAADFVNLHFDFFIGTFDNPESCNDLAEIVPHVLAYATTPRCRPNIIAIPDFIYGGWPEVGITDYTATCAAITAAGEHPPQHNKLFWIGNADMHPIRQKLIEIGRDHSADMQLVGMAWQHTAQPSSTQLAASHYVSLPDHAAYSMLLDIRGAGYSGRLKLLMHARRPVFLVERRFHEFFYPHLRAHEHYMPVSEDLSNLASRVAEVKQNKNLAENLAANASVFAAQHLTKSYALEAWRNILLRIGKKP